MITLADLQKICPLANPKRMAVFVEPLQQAMEEFEINTPPRKAAFIAQIALESGGFHYVKEIASGASYEGRLDLGNTEPGDGVKFKGRGLLQNTGRANYHACGLALGLDLFICPELLEQPIHAARSAGWFWKSHGLNELADAGEFKKITKRINGAATDGPPSHHLIRVEYYERALEVLA